MDLQIGELAPVLEEVLQIGEELRRNLAAQKQAIITWDVPALIEHIEAREAWMKLLSELEKRRKRILRDADCSDEPFSLRAAVAPLADGSAEKTRLLALGQRARRVFTELKDEEQYLHKLMSHLLAHVEEALRPLLQPLSSTYGETGAPERHRPASALLRSRV